MTAYEKLGVFYLGKAFDMESGKIREEMVLYDSKDLTTHAVIIGMTGSGKTGLALGLLEEALIDNIPVIAIDPKGDLPNLLLTFPGLTPEEFLPWVDDQDAAAAGLSRQQFAAKQADLWRKGLADWGQGPERNAAAASGRSAVGSASGDHSTTPSFHQRALSGFQRSNRCSFQLSVRPRSCSRISPSARLSCSGRKIGRIWLPMTVTDPGYDGLFGTSDDASLTVYGLRADRPAPAMKAANDADGYRKYWGATFTLEKRLADNWQVMGSLTLSSLKGNADFAAAGRLNRTYLFNSPNSLINTEGPLAFDRPLQAKVQAMYVFPFNITLGAYFQFYSGAPWARSRN